MKEIKNERIFWELSDNKVESTRKGRKQFFEEQSLGKKPINPDPYYVCLSKGKWQADWLTAEYRRLFFSGEWWGFLQLWKDWEGKRFVLPFLLSWHKHLPEWINKEISQKQLREEYFI